MKHAAKAYKPLRDELYQQRIAHLKSENGLAYEQTIDKMGYEFGKLTFEVTKAAAEFIELDEATFSASVEELMKDPNLAQQFYKAEKWAKVEVDTEGKELLSREKTKQFIMERMKMQFEFHKKLSDYKPKDAREAERIAFMTRWEIIDHLYIMLGITYSDFTRGLKEHDNIFDEEVKAVESMIHQERKNYDEMKRDEYKASIRLPRQYQKQLREMCEASVPVVGTPDINGLLAFEEYLKLFKLIVTLQIRFGLQIQEENKNVRRQALKNDDKVTFATTTSK